MHFSGGLSIQRETQCAKDYFENFPNLKNHFSERDARRVCQHEALWQKGVKRVKSAEESDLTSDQLSWLKSIWSCKKFDCLCDGVPACQTMLKAIKKILKRQMALRREKRDVPFNKGIYEDLRSHVAQKILPMSVRKEIRMLTDSERQTYIRAVNKLKSEKIDNMSKYDILIHLHTPEYSPSAHFCTAFLPFHREFVTNFEIALRQAEPDVVGSPYWDSEMDASLPNPAHSVLWTDEFFGPGEGYVQSGPYGHWNTLAIPTAARFNTSTPVLRILGNDTSTGELFQYAGLFKASNIAEMMNRTEFSQLTYCIDPFFEFLHVILTSSKGTIHDWVGGHMTDIPAAVNDPIFFVFHSFVDYLWELWRHKHQTREQRETDYPSDHGSCNNQTECFADSQLKPFSIKVIDALSNYYTDKLYTYSPRPTCDNKTLDCGSPYLFCDSTTIKCMSKVKIGGNCSGFEGQDICHKSVCFDGVCMIREERDDQTVEELDANIDIQSISQVETMSTEIATTTDKYTLVVAENLTYSISNNETVIGQAATKVTVPVQMRTTIDGQTDNETVAEKVNEGHHIEFSIGQAAAEITLPVQMRTTIDNQTDNKTIAEKINEGQAVAEITVPVQMRTTIDNQTDNKTIAEKINEAHTIEYSTGQAVAEISAPVQMKTTMDNQTDNETVAEKIYEDQVETTVFKEIATTSNEYADVAIGNLLHSTSDNETVSKITNNSQAVADITVTLEMRTTMDNQTDNVVVAEKIDKGRSLSEVVAPIEIVLAMSTTTKASSDFVIDNLITDTEIAGIINEKHNGTDYEILGKLEFDNVTVIL
uniref:Tyrosinase copper-binding domain-containing protein n=1 Tax=Romanomermis culicivorax TaxID=13658 RepID=A0A915KNQ0_ROMCU